MFRLEYAVVLTLVLLAFLVALVSLSKPLSLRVLGIARSSSSSLQSAKKNDVVSDILTRAVVRKVKVSKVGDYLILTLVLRTSVESSTEVEIEEPLILLSDGDVVVKRESVDELSV
ncbi:MAG: hypothetical protein QXK66_05205 [Sulfolobales archaeon]